MHTTSVSLYASRTKPPSEPLSREMRTKNCHGARDPVFTSDAYTKSAGAITLNRHCMAQQLRYKIHDHFSAVVFWSGKRDSNLHRKACEESIPLPAAPRWWYKNLPHNPTFGYESGGLNHLETSAKEYHRPIISSISSRIHGIPWVCRMS